MFLFTKVRNSLFPRKLDREIRREMETHHALLEEEARCRGLNPEEARAEVRRRFGSEGKHFEETWETSVSRYLSELRQDGRFAWRQMRRTPGFTAVALVVLGLGIGAVTTVFSLVEAVLLHSLPYGGTERLVYVWTPNPLAGANVPRDLAPSFPDFYAWQRVSKSFQTLATVRHRIVNLSAGKVTRHVAVAFVTGAFFRTLQVKPELGRAITAEDDQPGRGKVAVISDALWRARFAGDRGAIGKSITFDRERYAVIGVMPAEFGFPFDGDIPLVPPGFGRTEIWAPLALSTAEKTDRNRLDSADAVIGRLREGVTLQQAQSELAVFEQQLDKLDPPGFLQGWQVAVVPLVDAIVGPVRKMLGLLMGAVGLVLLIACANVANLLLARVAGRRGELALRAGLGAGRARLARQMVTESLLLALVGGGIGVLFAFGAVRVLARLNPGDIPRFDQMAVNGVVLGLAVAVAVLSGALFSLAPAHAVLQPDLSGTLKTGGRGAVGGSKRVRQMLVMAEVALSFVLLAGATLLIRSYVKLQGQDHGFLASTLTMNLSLDRRYGKAEQRSEFFLRFLEKLRHIPGVVVAGACNDLPLDHSESVGEVEIRGVGEPKDLVDMRAVTPGYLEAMGVRLLAGRPFEQRDTTDAAGAVIVNQAFAEAYLRGRDALTMEVRAGSRETMVRRPWASVIGVVGDIRHSTLEEKARPEYFQPYRPNFNAWNLHFAVRSMLPARAIAAAARAALHGMDVGLALDDMRTMEQRVEKATARRRFQTVLLSAFAGVAFLLSMIGVYGVIAYTVRQRTNEIGVRMALGATAGDILRMMTRQGLGMVVVGLVAGIGMALGLTRMIGAWLYGVAPNDPLTFAVLPVAILCVSAGACFIPALQASRVDPAIALRSE